MVKNPNRKCAHKGCTELALYGDTSVPLHCEEHREPNETDLVQRACASCGLPNVLGKTSKCCYCDPAAFVFARLVKQRKVKGYLDGTEHCDYEGYDEMLPFNEGGACGKERPDFWWDCGTHVVVLEVDEDQHGARNEACECTRMVNISQAFARPTHFVRYNPDRYKEGTARKRTAGESHLFRMQLLLKVLAQAKDTSPAQSTGAFCVTQRLFFDGWCVENTNEVVVVTFLNHQTTTAATPSPVGCC